MTSARFFPPDMAKPLFQRGIEDFEATLEFQKDVFQNLGSHPKGELLQGLADSYSRLGQTDKAEQYYARIAAELPNTPYAKRAATWMQTKTPLPAAQAGCIGCHNKK
jgi:TolA-binding protein